MNRIETTGEPMDAYQKYIHMSRYSRWNEREGRRETWPETVSRLVDFWEARSERNGWDCMEEVLDDMYLAILNMQVMPSMRALMTAGPALELNEMAGYNCSYIEINHPRTFDEVMYILMCGTGVGFSVERGIISKLPEIAELFYHTDTAIVVSDSRIGWASAFRELLSLLWAGKIPKWDLSRVRPAGARLKTFGGFASGPEPLDTLFHFAVQLFQVAAGRKFRSLECHDLVCKVADVVVCGGVRRSALLSLSNLSDDRMRNAKNGQWWEGNPQRALSNNSAAYTEKPDFEVFLQEWRTLYESKSGERGIFNRVAADEKAGENERRALGYNWGTNPCGEIILRPFGLCNLSEIVIRHGDTLEDLTEKARIATIIGTLQSTLTDFKYVRPMWKRNAEEERLLGVSLTGIMDHPVLGGKATGDAPGWLSHLREVCIRTNREWADRLGINPSAAVTCVKPSGTVSQLVNASSGIHPRYSEYYIRTVRSGVNDPITSFMKDSGVPWEPCVMRPKNTVVFSFPMKAPKGAVCKSGLTALDQLETYLMYRKYWCEHNPSITVYYGEDDFLGVGQWVWENWNSLCGVAFLPKSDHIYLQAPYQEITVTDYARLVSSLTELDWDRLKDYEAFDTTAGSQELACTAATGCEI